MIDNILLVGGSSCIPLVKKLLVDSYGVEKIKVSEKPTLAFAEGAAILSYRLGDEYETDMEYSERNNISYSTNHSYFIEIQNEDGSTELERIIEKQMPLPIQLSKVHKILNNYPIQTIELFAEVENGVERLTKIFLLFDRYYSKGNEMVININLDIDEVFNCSYYPKGKNELIKNAILGRGKKDSKFLDFLYSTLQKVDNYDISKSDKANFGGDIRRLVNKINQLMPIDPDSEIWSECGTKIFSIVEELKEKKSYGKTRN